MQSIDEVIGRMAEIDAGLPAGDGVGWFNRMYRHVTEEVQTATAGTTFEDAEFLTRLDIRFAELYFAAYEADRRGGDVPRSWAPLFDHRRRPSTHPIQFALAGMNAHINHDLPLAVVSVCRELGRVPTHGSLEHRDFTVVNEVLRVAYGEVKAWFAQGLAGTIDDVAGRVDDAVEMWCIDEARALAWISAQTLWSLDDGSTPHRLFLRMLDESVGLAGRGILV